MADKVRLTLTGRQQGDTGEETTAETKTTAEYYERNGGFCLLYDEMPENGEAVSKNMIKLKDGVLELTRKGAVCTRMVFQEGVEHRTDYVTPYGCLKLGVLTQSVTDSCRNGIRKIRAEYTLLSEGTPLSDCMVDILIEPLEPFRPFAQGTTRGEKRPETQQISPIS